MEFEWTSRLDPATLIIAIFAIVAFFWNVFVYFQQGPKIEAEAVLTEESKFGSSGATTICTKISISNSGSPTSLKSMFIYNSDKNQKFTPDFIEKNLTKPLKIDRGDSCDFYIEHTEKLFKFLEKGKTEILMNFSHRKRPYKILLPKEEITDGSGGKPGNLEIVYLK